MIVAEDLRITKAINDSTIIYLSSLLPYHLSLHILPEVLQEAVYCSIPGIGIPGKEEVRSHDISSGIESLKASLGNLVKLILKGEDDPVLFCCQQQCFIQVF